MPSDSRSGDSEDSDGQSSTPLGERWQDAEPDPEARWSDPEESLPTVPETRVPDVDVDFEEADVDPELTRHFWAAVLAANVGVAGIAIGAMVAYFRGDWYLGAGLAAVGAFGFARTHGYYRRFQQYAREADDKERPEDASEEDGDGRRGGGRGSDSGRDDDDGRDVARESRPDAAGDDAGTEDDGPAATGGTGERSPTATDERNA